MFWWPISYVNVWLLNNIYWYNFKVLNNNNRGKREGTEGGWLRACSEKFNRAPPRIASTQIRTRQIVRHERRCLKAARTSGTRADIRPVISVLKSISVWYCAECPDNVGLFEEITYEQSNKLANKNTKIIQIQHSQIEIYSVWRFITNHWLLYYHNGKDKTSVPQIKYKMYDIYIKHRPLHRLTGDPVYKLILQT